MKKNFKILSCLLLIILTFAVLCACDISSSKKSEKVKYTVTVVDEDENPVQGATVEIYKGDKIEDTATTDENGKATFKLREGKKYRAVAIIMTTYERIEVSEAFENSKKIVLTVDFEGDVIVNSPTEWISSVPSEKTEPGDTHAHEYYIWGENNATCENDGYIEYRCYDCGESYMEVLNATGHNYHISYTSEPSCNYDGYAEYTCSNCYDWYQETLYSTGHDYYVGDEYYASCYNDGYIEYRCNYCSDYYTETTNYATGHDYYVSYTNEPTCVDDGYVEYTCNNCYEWYTETLYATGEHNYELSYTSYPTCTEDGYEEYSCSHCGDWYQSTLYATGHYYIDGYCEYCGKYEY